MTRAQLEALRDRVCESVWNEYEPPRSNVSEAIQYPLDERFAGRVINAHLKDERARIQKADKP